MNKVIFIIGVSGSGKSTIGQLLSQRLRIPFFDGDDFHPQSNIDKMSQGKPLNDTDRRRWLQALNDLAIEHLKKSSCIIGCSALKRSYRDTLSAGIEDQVEWVHLMGSFEKIFERIDQREEHFMPPDLLQSQFDALEPPENALEVNVSLNPQEIVDTIERELQLK